MNGLDRRTFLGGAAFGALVAATGRAASRPSTQREEGRALALRRSCKLGMVGEGSTLLDKFALLADIGYDGVELDSPSDLDLDEVLRAKEATGLEVPGVVDSAHWRDTLGDPDREVRARGAAALERALRDAAVVGASTVLLVPAVVNDAIPYATAWENSRAEIARLVPLAEELGVAIAFENVWNHFLLSPLEAARYVDSFESEAVGWYLDPGNLVRNAWPWQWVEVLGSRILKLDVKAYSRAKRDGEGLWAGFSVEIGDEQDDTDWPRVLAALERVGYAGGWASAEVGGGDRERLAEVLARMDGILGAR